MPEHAVNGCFVNQIMPDDIHSMDACAFLKIYLKDKWPTELKSSLCVSNHSITSVMTSATSESGVLSPETNASRCSKMFVCESRSWLVPSGSSGALSTCSFLTRSGWKVFRHNGQVLGFRACKHLKYPIQYDLQGARKQKMTHTRQKTWPQAMACGELAGVTQV